MQRLALCRETCYQATFPSARVFVLLKNSSRQQSFFYFSNGQVVVLSFLIAMSRKVVITIFDFAFYPDYIKHFYFVLTLSPYRERLKTTVVSLISEMFQSRFGVGSDSKYMVYAGIGQSFNPRPHETTRCTPLPDQFLRDSDSFPQSLIRVICVIRFIRDPT